ncbi:MAG: hypothetical protein KGI27_02245 [Thaumarchaeota archaeon]|nr:hypothetical protein [Nitrososphaerota archaeon]
MEKEELESIKDLLILLLLRSNVSYEAISDVTGIKTKTLKNRFPMSKIVRGSKDD